MEKTYDRREFVFKLIQTSSGALLLAACGRAPLP